MKQAVTRAEDKEYDLFQETAANIGTTTSDALHIFIYAFNDYHGFRYSFQSHRIQVQPFETKKEATEFTTDLAMEIME